jgi:hypothetical protein
VLQKFLDYIQSRLHLIPKPLFNYLSEQEIIYFENRAPKIAYTRIPALCGKTLEGKAF